MIKIPCVLFNSPALYGLPLPVLDQLLLHPLQGRPLSGQHGELDGLVHQQLLNDRKGWLLVV